MSTNPYSDPEKVRAGVRDFIVHELRTPAEVTVEPGLGESFIRVRLPKQTLIDHPTFERDLQEFIPRGFTLRLETT
jgi:hypothetical protein